MNNDGSVYTEDAVVTQVFLSPMRKSDSYTVAIYEFWGQRGLRRRKGGGEGRARERFAHLNSDWVIVFGEAWKWVC